MLQASHLKKWFGEGDSKTYAVSDVSLTVAAGEMLYIMGPSGSGKTTLLSIISGILRPNEGQVIIDNKDIWQLSDDALTALRLYSIGFVFQDFHLFPRLTSQENVAIPLILQHTEWEEALTHAAEALKIVGLEKRVTLAPYKLSIGEQQRVAIARAIITRPQILIFDEPTASLDGETGRKIISFIRENVLNDECAIIIVTHDNRIEEFATRIVRMEDGHLSER